MTNEVADRRSSSRQTPLWWPIAPVAVLTIGAIFCIYGWYADRAVAQRERTTSGSIFAHDAANHSRYGYTFNVGEKTYSGWYTPVDSEQFTIGQAVTVHYDPLDPKNNALVDFNELSSRSLGPAPLLIGALLFVAVFVFVRRRTRSPSSKPSPG